MLRKFQRGTDSISALRLGCPVCRSSVVRLKPLESLDIRCDQCGADLVIALKYPNLPAVASVLVAYISASLQQQSGIELVLTVMIMSSLMALFALRLLGPFLPKVLRTKKSYLETLDLQSSHKRDSSLRSV